MNIFVCVNDQRVADRIYDKLSPICVTLRCNSVETLANTLVVYEEDENILILDVPSKERLPEQFGHCYTITLSETAKEIVSQDVRRRVEIGYDLIDSIELIITFVYGMSGLVKNNQRHVSISRLYGNIAKDGLFLRLRPFYDAIEKHIQDNESVIISGDSGTGKSYILSTFQKSSPEKSLLLTREIMERDVQFTHMIQLQQVPSDTIICIEEIENFSEDFQRQILRLAYNKKNKFVITTKYSGQALMDKLPRFARYFTHVYILPTVKEYTSKEIMSLIVNWLDDTTKSISPEAQKIISQWEFKDNFHEIMDLVRHLRRCDQQVVSEGNLPIMMCNDIQDKAVVNEEFVHIINENIYDLATIEKTMVKAVLRKNMYIKSRSAEDLGISVGSLNTKIKMYDLTTEEVMK